MIRVGLLFDSLSDNSGDKAIGIALEEYCQREGFSYEVINPFDYDKDRYSTVIIGGGFLIREPGDAFYDMFRLKGRHILNGVGIAAIHQLEYLNDYEYVTVRSENEKAVISSAVSKVEVTPCVTTSMTGEEIEGVLPNFSDRCIGVHLVADTIANCPDILEVVYNLPQDKVFIPFTHYNKDRSLMRSLPDIEKHLLLDDLSPKQLFSVVGKMELIITSSLHLSIFAYLQNIPFLTFYQEKTYDYFKDRGLEGHIFKTTEELEEKLQEMILDKDVDFTEKVKIDKKKINEHLSRMSDIIKNDGENFKDKKQASKRKRVSLPEDNLVKEQLSHVIESRDVVIRTLYGHLYED